MTGATKHVFNFVTDQFFYAGTGRPEIFPRIKFFGIIVKCLTDGSRHCQAKIGIDVDFGATNAPGDFTVQLYQAKYAK